MRGGYYEPARGYWKDGTIISSGGGGCRGGIGSNCEYHEDYEVEIGRNCNFSFEMYALCCMHDEIVEFLKSSESHIGRLLYQTYLSQQKEALKHYDERAVKIEADDAAASKLYAEKQKKEKENE